MSSTFCALHNRDNLSTKQRVIVALRKRFHALSHMVRTHRAHVGRTRIARR